MAQQVVFIDDIDGKSKAAETVSFGLDGSVFEIDLSGKNAEALRKALEPYVIKARKIGKVRKGTAVKSDSNDAAEIREWAAQNGFKVNVKGRVPGEIRAKFLEATSSK